MWRRNILVYRSAMFTSYPWQLLIKLRGANHYSWYVVMYLALFGHAASYSAGSKVRKVTIDGPDRIRPR
jgi:hypothetical protein